MKVALLITLLCASATAYFDFNQEFVMGFREGLTGRPNQECPNTKKSSDMEQLNEIISFLV